MATLAVRCGGKCGTSYLVEDLDAAALGIPQPLRRVRCPRMHCGAIAEFDAGGWLMMSRTPENGERDTLPTGTLDLRAGARPPSVSVADQSADPAV